MTLETDANAIAVSPRRFAEHLEILRAKCEPMQMSDLVRWLRDGMVPRHGVVVTFDDGYADNYWEAYPLLQRYDVPGTVYVAAGQLDARQEFWWDSVERVCLWPPSLPESLALRIGGTNFRFELGDEAAWTHADHARFSRWSWRKGRPPTRRHRLFLELSKRLRPLDDGDRTAAIDALLGWAKLQGGIRSTHRVLNLEELGRLDSRVLEVGAHSVTHPMLSRLTPDEQWHEINGSKQRLESILGKPVAGFAYPYGDTGDSQSLVRHAGFESACTTRADVVFGGEDPFRLPRFYVGNWDGDEFMRRLGGFLSRKDKPAAKRAKLAP